MSYILHCLQKVHLQMLYFSLHESENCADEYLEFLDGDTVDAISLGKYCGNESIGSVPSTSDGKQMFTIM